LGGTQEKRKKDRETDKRRVKKGEGEELRGGKDKPVSQCKERGVSEGRNVHIYLSLYPHMYVLLKASVHQSVNQCPSCMPIGE